MGLDIILAFKKYVKNIKVFSTISVLIVFILFLINPLFSLFGGSLNISYNILNQDPFTILLTLLALTSYIIAFTLFQTIIVYRIGNDYNFDQQEANQLKKPFFELLKFNVSFYLFMYIVLCFLYDIGYLENIAVNLLLVFIAIIFWFIPQIVVMEKESVEKALVINFNYIKKNVLLLIYLFVSAFILTLIAYFLDVLFGIIGGAVISTLFFVLFVIPFIEILKTEVYLDKYNLLKPSK